jgi:hypothetical protein
MRRADPSAFQPPTRRTYSRRARSLAKVFQLLARTPHLCSKPIDRRRAYHALPDWVGVTMALGPSMSDSIARVIGSVSRNESSSRTSLSSRSIGSMSRGEDGQGDPRLSQKVPPDEGDPVRGSDGGEGDGVRGRGSTGFAGVEPIEPSANKHEQGVSCAGRTHAQLLSTSLG